MRSRSPTSWAQPGQFDSTPGVGRPALARLAGARTVLAVPMLKDNDLIGAIVIYRTEVRPFTDKQIELMTGFAAQAVIAIENTRLLAELREALEQQTATSQVLQVISSSPGELAPVFEAMLANAVRICEAKFGNLLLVEGDGFRQVTLHGAPPPAYAELRRRETVLRPGPETILGRCARTKRVAHTTDLSKEQVYLDGNSLTVALVELAGARSVLSVPMLKENELIGAIIIYRQEVRPFTDKQIALVTNFAAQAVIAIENTRLLAELRESLEQQTATSEVLQVISSSPGELEPVFQAMLANAVRICEAGFGTLFRCDGERIDRAASVGTPPALVEFQKQRGPFRPEPDEGLLGRVFHTRQVAHTVDYAAEAIPGPPARLGGARSTVAVPMLKDDELVGAIVIYRTEVRPFTDKQIALVTNFARQAVIAIENTRLLAELRELLAAADRHLARCCRSSPARPASSSPCSRPCWRTRCASARPGSGTCFALRRQMRFASARCTAHRLVGRIPSGVTRFRPGRRSLSVASPQQNSCSTSPTRRTEEAYVERDPSFVPLGEVAGARTCRRADAQGR